MTLWSKLFGAKESPSLSLQGPSSVMLAQTLLVVSVAQGILSFVVILLSPDVRSHITAVVWVRNTGFWIVWLVLVALLGRRQGWARFAVLAMLAWNARNVVLFLLNRPTGATPTWLLSRLPAFFWIQIIGSVVLCIVFWTSWQRSKQVPVFWLWIAVGVCSLPASGRGWWSLQIFFSSTALRLCAAVMLFKKDSNAWFRMERSRVEPVVVGPGSDSRKELFEVRESPKTIHDAASEVKQLALRSPAHPAHKLALEADLAPDDHKRVELIDRALALSPQDMNLLYAKACSLERSNAQSKGHSEHIEHFGRLHPGHFDIAMRRRNFRFVYPFPPDWENLFDFESWSEIETKLKPGMLSRFRTEKHVQIVRHCLVPTIAIVSGAGKNVCARVKRIRWELRWASTPYGKIAVHYFLMDSGSGDTRKNEAFLPHGVSNPHRAVDGFFLLQRLAQYEDCFLVLADGDGIVHRNERFSFPESLKRTLKDLAKELDATGPAPNPLDLIDRAGKWYTDHTDFNSIGF